SGAASFWPSSRTVLTSFFWSLLSLRLSVRIVSLSDWVLIIIGVFDAPLPPPPRWAGAMVAARMPARNNLKSMRAPLLPSSSFPGAGGRIEHSGHGLECRCGLALLIGLEVGADLGEGLGLNAGHLGDQGGMGVHDFLE